MLAGLRHIARASLAHRSWKSELLLCLIFVLSLPLLNPWVRGDGVGYYALVRDPLIEHNFDFTHDYQHANPSFRDQRLDESGRNLFDSVKSGPTASTASEPSELPHLTSS